MITTFHHRRIELNDPQPRGQTACVTDDGKDWLYRVKRNERRAFKKWARSVFAGGPNCKRLAGAWPNYTITQP